jgi:hypothetical protein
MWFGWLELVYKANKCQIHVRKVKLLKAPKFDLGALLGLHGESSQDDSGQKVRSAQYAIHAHLLTCSRLSGNSRRRF